MPKKTRKEKLMASLHRKSALLAKQQQVIQSNLVKGQNADIASNPEKNTAYSFSYKKESNPKPKLPTIEANYTYVKHDLIKITIFTIFAISLQGMLYFLLNRH